MKEKLQEYALIAEVVSAIAIVISLIFVGIEISQNSEIQVQSNTQSVVREWRSSVASISINPELACVYSKGIYDFNALNGHESVMFSSFMLSQWFITQEMYFFSLDNLMDEEIWEGFLTTTTEVMGYPGAKQWWEVRKGWYSKDFQIFINEIAEQQNSTIPDFIEFECN